MHTQNQLARHRMTHLRTQADAYRLAAAATPPKQELRTRLGWTLVEVGLRLAAPTPA
ncbi:hypothetical protein AB0D38_15285 [Streptomyces sp. NPDC048279]|uniref:hypothetical protein n=1 Tax=unclassified Streptomyces TaxID=2593676 RepID=UPI003419EA98